MMPTDRTNPADALVSAYLRQLARAAATLRPNVRVELVDQIRERVDAALAAIDHTDEATVRSVLDRIGDPDEIVAATGQAPPASAWRRSALVAFSVAGVVLLWTCSRGTARDKLLGTFVLPGEIALPLVGLLVWSADATCEAAPAAAATGAAQSASATRCTSSGLPAWLAIAMLAASILAPLAVGAYLGMRACRTSADGAC